MFVSCSEICLSEELSRLVSRVDSTWRFERRSYNQHWWVVAATNSEYTIGFVVVIRLPANETATFGILTTSVRPQLPVRVCKTCKHGFIKIPQVWIPYVQLIGVFYSFSSLLTDRLFQSLLGNSFVSASSWSRSIQSWTWSCLDISSLQGNLHNHHTLCKT